MKTTRILSASGIALLTTAAMIALTPSAKAAEPLFPDAFYTLTINISSLVANSNGPFSLDLQLAQGSGNVTNSVTLSNFQFVGGSPVGTPDFTAGNETGSLTASGVKLTNTDIDNEFAEELSAGVTQISFTVDETRNSEVVNSGTPIPDQFNVAILDGNLNNIPTTDVSGGNALVSSAISTTTTIPTVDLFSSTSPDGGVTVAIAAPEPSSTAMLLLGVGGLLAMLGLRRRSA